MSKITINGKDYNFIIDSFGITIVEGKSVDEFLESLPVEDHEWLVNRDLQTIYNEPEYFDEVANRMEIPKKYKDVLDQFKPQKGVGHE